METELNDEFFQYIYSLPKESEVIISDNEVFTELELYDYVHIYDEKKLYIDIDIDQIDSLVKIYFKKLFDPDDHLMLFDHTLLYSYYDCIQYIKIYSKLLQNYEYNYSLFVDDQFYKNIYLTCKRMSEHHLLIRPKKFTVFKAFINQYYDYIITQIKLTIKYLNYNVNLYKEPLINVYFSNVELLNLLTSINELIATKTTFKLFREYGIPIKMKNKMNLISNSVLNQYISKNLKEVIIDIKILLIEFYKYEYSYQSINHSVSVNYMLLHNGFIFD
jgi:hypothetical protein